MELLGNKNKSENLLIKLQETNRKVLTASSLSEEELKDILCLLDALLTTAIFYPAPAKFSLCFLCYQILFTDRGFPSWTTL